MKFTQEEIEFLDEAGCYTSLEELVWEDANWDDVNDYIRNKYNWSKPLIEWYVNGAPWYFEYNGLYFINRAYDEFDLEFDELLEKLDKHFHFETESEFYDAIKKATKE